MKKYFLMAMMCLMSIGSFAESNDASILTKSDIESNVKKFEMKVNQRRLACVLDMTIDQMESADIIIRELDDNMAFAGTMGSESSSNKIVGNAVKKNLKYMHYILNDDQYKKYVQLLNLTLQNKGFDITEICK